MKQKVKIMRYKIEIMRKVLLRVCLVSTTPLDTASKSRFLIVVKPQSK